MTQKLEFKIKDLVVPDWIKQRFEDYVSGDSDKHRADKAHLREHADLYLGILTLYGEWLEKWTLIRNQTGAGDLAGFSRAIEQFAAIGVIYSERAILATSPGQAAIFESRARAIKFLLEQRGWNDELLLSEIDKKIYPPKPAEYEARRSGQIVSDADLETAVELAFRGLAYVDSDFLNRLQNHQADQDSRAAREKRNLYKRIEGQIEPVARNAVSHAILFAHVDDILEQRNRSATEALAAVVIEELVVPGSGFNDHSVDWKSFFKYGIHDLMYEVPDSCGEYLDNLQELLFSVCGDGDLIQGAIRPDVGLVVREADRWLEFEANNQTLKSQVCARVGAALCRKAWETTRSEWIVANFEKAIQALEDEPDTAWIDKSFDDSWKRKSWHLLGQFEVRRGLGVPVFDSFVIDFCGYQYQKPRDAGLAAGYRGVCESVSFCLPDAALGAIGCDHPARYSTDRDGRLHDEGRKAIEWADGWGVYALDGVALPEDLWTKVVTKQLTAREVAEIENADLRSVALKYNPAALIDDNARLLDCDSVSGDELYLFENTGLNSVSSQSKIYLLKMQCPTGRTFVKFVEPNFAGQNPTAACQARAWGISGDTYRNVVEHG